MPGAMGHNTMYQDVQHIGKYTRECCVFLAMQVAANLNSIYYSNEASRGCHFQEVVLGPCHLCGVGSSSSLPQQKLQSQSQPEHPLCIGVVTVNYGKQGWEEPESLSSPFP